MHFLSPVLHLLRHFLLIFLGRHWLLGFSNAVLTALSCLGLLAAGRRWKTLRLSPASGLRLRHAVLTLAAAKGALLLVVGEGYPRHAHAFVVLGLQFPDVLELLGLAPRSFHSVWYPSAITGRVSLALLGLAAGGLLTRAIQVGRAERTLDRVAAWDADLPGGRALRERAARAHERAARQMGLPETDAPPLLLVEMTGLTPMLLGLRHPRILLAPRLAEALTDDELDAALRHELAHFLRRDHRWRWLRAWITDVGRVIAVTGWLADRAEAEEEELCDRLASVSPADVRSLASALTKSAAVSAPGTSRAPDRAAFVSLPSRVVPSLVGRSGPWRGDARAVRRRLERLVGISAELRQAGRPPTAGEAPHPAQTVLPCARLIGARVAFGLALLLLVYVKYLVYLNVF